MLQNSSEFNSVGGGYGYGGFGGGFGGGSIIEGLLLGTLLNRRGGNGLFGGEEGGSASLEADGIAAKTALLINQNADQNALLGAIAANNATTVQEGRALASAICESEKTNLQQFYANAVQQARLAQDIQNQASAIAVVNDNRFDAIERAGVNQTAAILARINQSEVDSLRDQLHETRRGRDAKEVEIQINNSAVATQAQLQAQNQFQIQRDLDNYRRKSQDREIEINNINTNTNVQAQLQAQAQAQSARDFQHTRILDALVSQNQKVGQDIVNIGGLVAANQTSTPTNVNSKQ